MDVFYEKCLFESNYITYALQMCRSSSTVYDAIYLFEHFAPSLNDEQREEFLKLLEYLFSVIEVLCFICFVVVSLIFLIQMHAEIFCSF